MPWVVVRQDNRITGYLMTSTRIMNDEVPIIRAMFNTYQGTDDAYWYGLICIATEGRGKRLLAQAMFLELRRMMPSREGILFMRGDNTAHCAPPQKWGWAKSPVSFLMVQSLLFYPIWVEADPTETYRQYLSGLCRTTLRG